MEGHHLVYEENDIIDLFQSPKRDDSIIRWEYTPIPESAGFLSLNNGFPAGGNRMEFIVQNPGLLILPSRSFVNLLWQPWSQDANAPITNGTVAYANSFPLFDGLSITWGSSTMEEQNSNVALKTIVKNLLKYSGSESYDGTWLFKGWAPDTGVSPTHGTNTTNTYYPGGFGDMAPTTITNTTTIAGSIPAPTITFEATGGATPTLASITNDATDGMLQTSVAGVATNYASVTAVSTEPSVEDITSTTTSTSVVNPSFNKGFYLRNLHTTQSMNQPIGGAWTSINAGASAVATAIPLAELSDVFGCYDKLMTGASFKVGLTINQNMTGLIQLAKGTDPPAAPHTVKILAVNLQMPVISMDELIRAKFYKAMLEKEKVFHYYSQVFVYTQNFTLSSPQTMVNWFVSNFNQRVLYTLIGFKYPQWWQGTAGSAQLNNQYVFQGIPATNVLTAYLDYNGRTFPDPASQPGLNNNPLGPNLLTYATQAIQERLTDREGSSCINWSQFAYSGNYSFLVFDSRYQKIEPTATNANSAMNLYLTLNCPTGANIPLLPDYNNASNQITLYAFVFTEAMMKLNLIEGGATSLK